MATNTKQQKCQQLKAHDSSTETSHLAQISSQCSDPSTSNVATSLKGLHDSLLENPLCLKILTYVIPRRSIKLRTIFVLKDTLLHPHQLLHGDPLTGRTRLFSSASFLHRWRQNGLLRILNHHLRIR